MVVQLIKENMPWPFNATACAVILQGQFRTKIIFCTAYRLWLREVCIPVVLDAKPEPDDFVASGSIEHGETEEITQGIDADRDYPFAGSLIARDKDAGAQVRILYYG